MGEALFDRLVQGLSEESPTSIRINPFKCADTTAVADAQPVPWCRNGYYLKSRPNFTFDPLLHGGLYYVQEASSMFIDHVLRTLIHEPVRMLDLCAAPGGKTTCAMSALPKGSILFSNEPIHNRAQILNENVLKFGHPDIVVTNSYPKDYRKARLTFDVILTDVPCSGEGMFRKDEGAIREWSLTNVEKCCRLQREIVETIWPCLRPGGLLIYSTCTFNSHEDEENALWIANELGADFIEIPIEKEWNIVGSLLGDIPVHRFLPGITHGEGLFVAVLRKKDTSPAFPSSNNSLQALSSLPLKIMSHGPLPDTIKGKKSIPDVSKVLSLNHLDHRFLTAELTWRDAISYLQGQSIVLPPHLPKDFIALTYQGTSFGLVKNLGNRANNLHPQPWRIRTTHIPEKETKIIQL